MQLKQALIEAGYTPVYEPSYDLRHRDTSPEDIKVMDRELAEAQSWAEVVDLIEVAL